MRDLWLFCWDACQRPGTNLFMKLNPNQIGWETTQEYLLAETVDSLHWIIHQLNKGKGEKPKPVPRPGIETEKKNLLTQGGVDGFTGLDPNTLQDVRDWLPLEDPRWAEALGISVPTTTPALPDGYTVDARGRIHGPNGKFAKDPRLN